MCARRVKARKQMWIQGVAKSDNTSANEQSEDVELTMKVQVVADIDNNSKASNVANISRLPECHMPATTTSPTSTRQLLRNLLSFTLITMLYLLLSLPAPSLIEAAPAPWSNACGYTLANDSANKQHVNRTAPRAKILCELRGNLTKQNKTLRPFMGPKNVSKVYSKHSYAFLKVAGRKNLTLSTWHKHLQVYALTVDRLLGHASNYKKTLPSTFNSNKSDNITNTNLQRLEHLNNSLRGILCDIQMAASSLKGRPINTTIDVVAANKRIQLSTDKRSHNEDVDRVDIDIVYDKLGKFLSNMRRHIGRIYTCRGNRKGKGKTSEASTNRRRLQAKHNHSKKP
ncbi:uncharacterized protein LOC126759849 isoform X2 [Bactrocera neohumeralis]|nr:uncharacterized protein LOC126759849 isoform X2 [Bactrocera neohumeralis]XP_050330969.1 uncharacterized protein LOC126759849 isoform X2 [Bactrocera neohumeralis]XP_050330970.1 uncharacterized protein LOC126759849 isoform X2 [Bactrocera neohumeralis]